MPPGTMLNYVFLKQVLAEEKKLLRLSDVKLISCPRYNELSVRALWPYFKHDELVMKYMPDKLPEGRLPDRSYLHNVINTIWPNYFEKVLHHAHSARFSAQEDAMQEQSIVVSDAWWEKLNSIPFTSRKFFARV